MERRAAGIGAVAFEEGVGEEFSARVTLDSGEFDDALDDDDDDDNDAELDEIPEVVELVFLDGKFFLVNVSSELKVVSTAFLLDVEITDEATPFDAARLRFKR